MKIIVPCGPSYEPIDRARRMVNMYPGKLGVTLVACANPSPMAATSAAQ